MEKCFIKTEVAMKARKNILLYTIFALLTMKSQASYYDDEDEYLKDSPDTVMISDDNNYNDNQSYYLQLSKGNPIKVTSVNSSKKINLQLQPGRTLFENELLYFIEKPDSEGRTRYFDYPTVVHAQVHKGSLFLKPKLIYLLLTLMEW